MAQSTFSLEDMPAGMTELNSGNLRQALTIFQNIIDSMGDSVTAEPYQQLGICLRMLADRTRDDELYRLADEMFTAASHRTKSYLHYGQILRDWATVAIGQQHYDRAHDMLKRSRDLLSLIDEDPRQIIELSVTRGFIARVYYLRGGHTNRIMARRLLREIDTALYGIAPYELNNRVWSFKVAPLWYRLRWGPRTLRLAWQDGNFKRAGQVLLLVICRPLAIRLRK